MSMDIKVGIYKGKFSSIKSPDPFIALVLQVHVKYFSCFITNATWHMATKLGKVVTHYKKRQSITSQNSLMTCR